MSLLLIYPPFAHPRSPHLAIPTLASYLRQNGIDVTALDANLEFFYHFLSEKNIDDGKRFVEDAVQELNARDTLGREEKGSYISFATLLQSAHGLELGLESVFGRSGEPDILAKEDAFRLATALAGAPKDPEKLVMQGNIPAVQYVSKYSNFSTDQILESTSGNGILGGFFEKILPPILAGKKIQVVGISIGVEDQLQAAFRCARVIKDIAPDIHVTIGGSFVSTTMRSVKNEKLFEVIDSMVLDDGERPLVELIGELSVPEPDFSRIAGLVYYDGKEIRRNPPGPSMDLESLPPPDFSLLPFDRYLLPSQVMSLPFRSSRGCYWAKCAYCRTDSPIVCYHQQASADYLFESLKSIVDQTDVRSFAFTDEASVPKEMEKLAGRLVSEGLQINWGTCFRMEKSLTADRCRAFRQSGCVNVNFGLEVYNQRLLKLIRKGMTIDDVLDVLPNVAGADIFVFTYLMVGLPTETEHEALAGYEGIRWLWNRGFIGDYSYSAFQLYRDSVFYNEREKYGIGNISVPDHHDLDGPIHEFEVSGMSRETAEKLCNKFNMSVIPEFDTEIPIQDRRIPIKHDLKIIFEEEYLS